MFLAGGLHGDLDVLAEGGEKVHEALDGKGAGAVAHQGGDVRLLDAEDLASFGLLEAATFDEAVNLESKLSFQDLLFRMGEAEVGKDISTAFLCPDWFSYSGSHVSSAFLCGGVPLGLTLNCDDLTRLDGYDAREAGGYEGQQVFETV
jgi:hypothetical protein